MADDLIEYVNILPSDALSTDFLRKRYNQQVYRSLI